MISVSLAYPGSSDIYYFKVPIPFTLKFDDSNHYWAYLDIICDIVDDLEYLTKRNRHSALKLSFCKDLLQTLAVANLT